MGSIETYNYEQNKRQFFEIEKALDAHQYGTPNEYNELVILRSQLLKLIVAFETDNFV